MKEIILGIDPGTTRIGYGVIEKDGGSLRNLEYGCLEIDDSKRLLSARESLIEILDKYKPARVGIEKLFFMKNAKTAMSVSEARGVIMLTLQERGMDIREFTPMEVKQGVSGYGSADKRQIQKMVKLILNLESEPQPDDAADGLAIAICCSTLPAIDF